MHHMQAVLMSPEEGSRSPGPEVTDDCELPCGHWESKLGPLQWHQLLSTAEHLSSSLPWFDCCFEIESLCGA